MTDPNPRSTYSPKHPSTYRLARLYFTAALRQNDSDITAAAARALGQELAQELDQGELPIDQAGVPLKPLPGETVARLPVRLRLLPGEGTVSGTDAEGRPVQVPAPREIHVVDADGRVIEIPAPRALQNERRTVPLTLHSGAAWLSLALSGPALSDADRLAVIHTASMMFRNLVPDDVRRALARAIVEIHEVNAEPPMLSAADLASQIPELRARIVSALENGGPVFAQMVVEAKGSADPMGYARRVYDTHPTIYGKLFSSELLADLGLAARDDGTGAPR